MSFQVQDSEIFDFLPIDRKQIGRFCRQQVQRIMGDQCQSLHIYTQNKVTDKFNWREESSEKGQYGGITAEYLEENDRLTEELFNKIQNFNQNIIQRITNRVKLQMDSLTYSLLNDNQKYLEPIHQNTQKSQKENPENQFRSQLSESNKNFLVQLFSELGLLKKFTNQDRSFVKLVNEAQKQYYQNKEKVKNKDVKSQKYPQVLKDIIKENIDYKKSIQKKDRVSEILQEVKSTKIDRNTCESTKKRLLHTKKLFEQQFEFDQKVIGYSSLKKPYEFQFQETIETSKETKKFGENSSIDSRYYFKDPKKEIHQCSKKKQQQNIKKLHFCLHEEILNRFGSIEKVKPFQ